jgi:phage tail sheath protein FI
MTGGAETTGATDADLIRAYDLYRNTEDIDLSVLFTGDASAAVARHVIQNVAEARKDCVVCVSPERADVVPASGTTAESARTNVIDFKKTQLNISSSYGILDSGWKYVLDKYNNKFRWIPLNSDVAGCIVRTDTERDPWFSPAGYNRGQIKNVIKLAWSPNKAQRDDLYRNDINPVVTFPGRGTVLFGDKTLYGRNSAFDRINVRRLFIVLEKAIATASKFLLFEFNDEFTRAQFRNMVEPFLRDVKGRRGITDFKVVCDETNNPGSVVDRSEFVGDIYIKPARSINYIQLNFVAAATGVEFSEIIGQTS